MFFAFVRTFPQAVHCARPKSDLQNLLNVHLAVDQDTPLWSLPHDRLLSAHGVHDVVDPKEGGVRLYFQELAAECTEHFVIAASVVALPGARVATPMVSLRLSSTPGG